MSRGGVESITNFLEIYDWLGTGGQPDPSQIAALGAAGYDVVINLAMPDSRQALVTEGALVAQEGMVYVHLAIPWEAPTPAHVDRFFGLMDLYQDDKVFVHCIKNMRVAVLVFAYRVCRLHVPVPLAKEDMLKIWHPHGRWHDLMIATLAEFGFAYG
jgi:protein tyrosine phosphatase (PTP) superfamily phosphohydrolase (DUF442 family)